MADSTLITVLVVFVALCALSQLGIFLAAVLSYRQLKILQERSIPLIAKAEDTLESAKFVLDDSRKQIGEISRRTNEILDTTQGQLTKLDGFMTDAEDRARVQMERVEFLIGDTVERIQSVVSTTQDGLLRPLKEVNALVSGIRGGLGFLFRKPRPSVADVKQDEEMFI